MSHFEHLIAGLNHWQIDGVVTWLLLQGAIFTVVPEEVVVLSIGVLVGRGRVNPIEGFLAVELGLLPANLVIVFIASRFGDWKFFQREAIRRALDTFKKKGKWIIFGTRFTPLFRGPVYASAGLSGVRLIDFFKLDASASLIQVPLLMTAGYWVGLHSGSIVDAYRTIGTAALIIASAALLFALTRKLIVGLRASE
jgi:membrane protein DedA with SNARE-associated domain